jgi:hypothetical protein
MQRLNLLLPLCALYLGLNLEAKTATDSKLRFKVTKSITPWIWVKMRVQNDVSIDGTAVWNTKAKAWCEVDF